MICRGRLFDIASPEILSRKFLGYKKGDVAEYYGIGNSWFVLGNHTGDCGSWAAAVVR